MVWFVPVQPVTDPRVEVVGRAAELRELEVLLQWAVGGRGRAAYVMGDAGMGKTRLVEAVAARAAESRPSDISSSRWPTLAWTGLAATSSALREPVG